MRSQSPTRSFLARSAALAVVLVAMLAMGVSRASAAPTVGALHLGTSTGTENYLFTAGNQVSVGTPTGLTSSEAYRLDVLTPAGAVKHSSACFNGNNAPAGDSYTIGAADPASGATGYRWIIESFTASTNRNTNLASCNSATAGTGTIAASKYFDVVLPQVDGTTGFSGNQTVFSPTQTAYTRFTGASNRNPDTGVATAVATSATDPQWSVKWLNGLGGTVCSNSAGGDRPDSSAAGALPASAPGYLQFAPASGASGVFNDIASYDSLCAAATSGSYAVELRLGTKQFVQMPAFNIDADAPALTLNAVSDTNSATPSFSGAAGSQAASATTFADSSTVNVKIYSGLDTSGAAARTFTTTAAAGSWSLPSSAWAAQSQSALPEGTYTVVVQQADGGGNTAQWSGVFKVDTTAPAVTLTSPATSAELNDTTPAFGGAAGNLGQLNGAGITNDSQTVTLRIYSGHSASGSAVRTIPVTKVGNQWTVGDQQWTDNSQAPLAAGTYTAQAEQFDGAGNRGLSSAVTFKVDPTAPAVTISTPDDGLNTTGTTPGISGTAGTTAADDFNSSDLATVTVKVYSGSTAGGTPQRTFTLNGGGGSWAVGNAEWTAAGALTQGQWTIQAEQSDGAGNVGKSATRTIRVDQDAPFSTTSVTGATNSSAISVGYTDTDTGSSQSGVKQVALYAKGPGDSAFAQVAVNSSPGASGSFSYTATKGQGRYFFATVATDNAGNSEPLPSDGGIGKAYTHYDTTAPAVGIASAPAIGNDTTPAISGSAGSETGNGEPAADSATVTVDVWSGTDTNQQPARSLPVTRSGGSWSLGDAAWSLADQSRAPLTQGTWTIRARQSDEAGNTGASTSQTIVVDTTAPQTSDDVPTTWQKNPVQAHLSASDTGGGSVAAIHYTTDGSTPTLASPTYSSAVTLQNGQSIKYFAVDTAGNAESVKTSAAAQVDQQPPTTTDNVPTAWQANDVQVTLTPVDSGGSGVGQTYYTTDGSTPTTASSVYTAPVTLQNGQSIKYFSTDVAGNSETVKTSAAAKVDKTAPTSQASVGTYVKQAPISVSYTVGDGQSGVKEIDLYAKAPGASTFSLAGSVSSPSGSGAFSYSASGGDGNYSFYTVAEDNVGNRETVPSSGTRIVTTQLDTAAPVTTDDIPSSYVNHDVTVTLSPSDPSGSGVAVTRYTTDGTTPTDSSPAYTAPFTVTSSSTVKYFSVDNAGNREGVHTTAVQIDRAAPSTQAAGSAASTNSSPFTIAYGGSDTGGSGLDHVELYAKGPNDSGYSLAGTDTTPNDTRSFSYTATQGQGAYSFYTRGYDTAGNAETFDSGKVLSINYDTDAPAPTVTAPNSGVTLSTATPHLTGTAGTLGTDATQVSVQIFSGSDATGTLVQTKTANVTSGSWAVDADSLPDGTYTVRAQQSDAAGNTGTSNTRTFSIDAHPPIPSVTTPVAGARVADPTPTIAGTGSTLPGDDPAITVHLYAGSSASGTDLGPLSATVGGDGSWSVDVATPLADGDYTVQAAQSDAANTGTSTPVTFAVDSHAPTSHASSPALSASTSISVGYSAADAAGGTGLAKVELWAKGPGDSTYAKVAEDASPAASGSLNYLAAKGDGTYRFYTIAVDRAGNREAPAGSDTSTQVSPTALDTHSPSISSSNQGQTYAQNSAQTAAYSCADEPGGSGIAACTGDVASGAALDTAAPGPHSYHVTARDQAGNEIGATISYTVSEQHVQGDLQDTQAPGVSSAGTRRSQALSGGALGLDFVCTEACNVRAGGTISLPGGAKVYRLKTVAGGGAAGKHVRLKLKLDKKTLKAVRAALRKKRKVVAKVKATVTDAAGNRRSATVSVRITKA